MQVISDTETLEQIKTGGAVCILFGGEHCSVCHSLRPQLTAMLEQHYADMRAVYIDCAKSPGLCAQTAIFSLPAVKVYIEGMLVTEDARAFSLHDLMQRIEKSYALWLESKQQ